MTEQKLFTPTLVLMAGYAGSGKTTLAQALGRTLHWPVIDKDRLKQLHLVTQQDLSLERAGFLAFELFFALAEDFLVRQRLSVILDSSALHTFILRQAIELVYAADAHLKIVHCLVDDHTRVERLHQRNAQCIQLYVEPIALEHPQDPFYHLPKECTIIVNTAQHSFEEYFERTLLYLRS